MLARNRKPITSFGQAQTVARYELYIPGELSPMKGLLPSIMEESEERMAPLPLYEPGWTEPRRVPTAPAFVEPELKRFQTGQTLRKWGKESIFKRLGIITTPIPYKAETIPGEEELQQYPHYFVDGVPGFGQIPFGLGNSFGQSPEGSTRGWWGELVSALSVGAQQYLELEKEKYTAEIQASQAQQAALVPASLTAGFTASSILPLIIIGGLAFMFLSKGKKVTLKRKRR